ncbi:DUF4382 domain-containing protein [uncultured Rikenella sp.]|uniref:DUF4382 domain-containing protein n=1 Tax=uncultured Rikenella sp. TaxID=368003 RepID=UPI00272C3E75|nr:DUF4382 domain-containing protein [uncultured Rikenella sp.]
MVRQIFKTLGLLSILLWLGACSDVNDRNRLSVYVCDAPADYTALDCYVAEVAVRAGDGTWRNLEIADSYLPLMNLVNGKMQLVAEGTMPQGAAYDAARIVFSTEKATVRLLDQTVPLAVDPADATVVVPFPSMTMNGPNRPLLFDIDLAASVVEDPAAESGYRFRPRVTFVDTDLCGVVQGGLQVGESALSGRVRIEFIDPATGSVVASTYSSLNPVGAFFMRLLPGEYIFRVDPRATSGIRPYSAPITIASQQITDLGNIVLERVDL